MVNRDLHQVTITYFHRKIEEVLVNTVVNSHQLLTARQALTIEGVIRLGQHELRDIQGKSLQGLYQIKGSMATVAASPYLCHNLE